MKSKTNREPLILSYWHHGACKEGRDGGRKDVRDEGREEERKGGRKEGKREEG